MLAATCADPGHGPRPRLGYGSKKDYRLQGAAALSVAFGSPDPGASMLLGIFHRPDGGIAASSRVCSWDRSIRLTRTCKFLGTAQSFTSSAIGRFGWTKRPELSTMASPEKPKAKGCSWLTTMTGRKLQRPSVRGPARTATAQSASTLGSGAYLGYRPRAAVTGIFRRFPSSNWIPT